MGQIMKLTGMGFHQSDGTHSTGIWRQFLEGYVPVHGVLVDLELPSEPFKPPTLGVKYPDLGGSPHPISQILEVWESGTTLAPQEPTW